MEKQDNEDKEQATPTSETVQDEVQTQADIDNTVYGTEIPIGAVEGVEAGLNTVTPTQPTPTVTATTTATVMDIDNIKIEPGTLTATTVTSEDHSVQRTTTSTSNNSTTPRTPYTISQHIHMSAMEMDANKRRSSSRSIKRRRFDDELVEYSLGIPGPSAPKIERKDRKPFPPTTPIPSTVSVTSPVVYPEVTIPTPQPPSIIPAPVVTPNDSMKRRLSNKLSTGNTPTHSRRPRRKPHLSQQSTKDLGRWKPTDDLALIIGIQQTNDLRTVHRGIKFSCRFTVSEIQSRWYALLFNPEISRVAVAAMRNLHPDIIASVRSKALFSNGEEEILSTLTSNSKPTIEKFQELLEQNPSVFYPTRTAKSLMGHWQLLKQYTLLPDQTVQPLPKGDAALSFSEAEEQMNDSELQEPKDEVLETELNLADRWNKKEIRLLENSVGRWQVLVDSVSGAGTTEFDKLTFAVLRGRNVRYLMRSREISVGRSTKDHTIDADLSLEGPSNKISRRQATIRLRNSGDFFMASEGKRAIYVDGRPILRGYKVKLNNNSVIEISSLRFIFTINQEVINNVRHETVKNNSTLIN